MFQLTELPDLESKGKIVDQHLLCKGDVDAFHSVVLVRRTTPDHHSYRPLQPFLTVGPRASWSGVFYFAETAISNVVHESSDSNGLRNPRMRAEFLQLVADIFFDVSECVEEGGGHSSRSCAILNFRVQVLLGSLHQPAIGVIDDHDFLGAQQIVRHN